MTETLETNMHTWNTNAATFAAVERDAEAPTAFTPASPNKSLYVAPPRFDIEGWIFISVLTAFTAALAVLVLAR